jgi:cyclohexyl-isocyanide hydratase
MEDREIVDLYIGGASRRFVTSVCAGALVWAAGLLRGYRAATHWASMDNLSTSAPSTKTRVCIDRNRSRRRRHRRHRFRAGRGEGTHRSQDGRESSWYECDPQPPFAGSPDTAPAGCFAYRDGQADACRRRGHLARGRGAERAGG